MTMTHTQLASSRPLARRPSPGAQVASTLTRWLTTPSPVIRQAPFTVLFVIGISLSMWTPFVLAPDPSGLLVSTAMIGAATVFAVVVTVRPRLGRLSNLVAAADFFAILELRHATGDSKSLFGVLVVIPLLWMARNVGRRYAGYATAGVALVYWPTFLVPGAIAADPFSAVRVVFVTVVFGLTAFTVNELFTQASQRFDTSQALERAYANQIEQGGAVQQALLPKADPIAEGYEVTGTCIPAAMVGGDFYDWYPISDGLGFTLGDVMGKGVGAGIIAATARAVIRSARDFEDPTVALRLADASLSDDLSDVGSFATVFHARLQVETGLVRYTDAGHGLTMHLHRDGTWERLPSSGLPIGVGIASGWDAREVTLAEGDLLVSFSDGVLDFYDGSLNALDHLAVLAHGAASADALVASVRQLADDVDHDDDVTVVVVRRPGALVRST